MGNIDYGLNQCRAQEQQVFVCANHRATPQKSQWLFVLLEADFFFAV